MVGLGERPEEVEEVMDDLLAQGCKILTIGQYLQPTHRHYPVADYITPDQFKLSIEQIGLKKGIPRSGKTHLWLRFLPIMQKT